jgi:hypothetical protein
MFCWEAKEYEFKTQIFKSKDLRLRRLKLQGNSSPKTIRYSLLLRKGNQNREDGIFSSGLQDIKWKEITILKHHQIIHSLLTSFIIDENSINQYTQTCPFFQHQEWITITRPPFLFLHHPYIEEPNLNLLRPACFELILPILNMKPIEFRSLPTASVVTSLPSLSPKIDWYINSHFPLWISPFVSPTEVPPQRDFRFDQFLHVNVPKERETIADYLISSFGFSFPFFQFSSVCSGDSQNESHIFDRVSIGRDISIINNSGFNWIHSVQIAAPYSFVDQRHGLNILFRDPGIIALDDTLILEVESCHAREVSSEGISYGFILNQINPISNLLKIKNNSNHYLQFPPLLHLDFIHQILSIPNQLMYATLDEPKFSLLWSHKSLDQTYPLFELYRFPRQDSIPDSVTGDIIHHCLSIGDGGVVNVLTELFSNNSLLNSITMVNESFQQRLDDKGNHTSQCHSPAPLIEAKGKRKVSEIENSVEQSPSRFQTTLISNHPERLSMKGNESSREILTAHPRDLEIVMTQNPVKHSIRTGENDFHSSNISVQTIRANDNSSNLKTFTDSEAPGKMEKEENEIPSTKMASPKRKTSNPESNDDQMESDSSKKLGRDDYFDQLSNRSPRFEPEMSDIINSYLQLHGSGNDISIIPCKKTRDLIQIPCSDPQMSILIPSLQVTKPQSTDQMEGLSLLISEDLLVSSPIYSTLLFQKYKIRCIDSPLESPLAFIIDEVTGVCLLFNELFSSRETLKAYLRKLTSLAFKFNILWLVIVTSENVIVPQDLFASLCQSLTHFPCSVDIRYCRHLSVASLVHKLCQEAANFGAVHKGILLSTFKERPMLGQLDNMVFSAHCMFFLLSSCHHIL